MRRSESLPRHGLFHFRHPYRDFEPVRLGWRPDAPDPGGAVVWFMAPVGNIYPELDWVSERPGWLPLFIVLPEPEDVLPIAPILRVLPELGPRGVVPVAGRGLEPALRTLLASPPRALPAAVADQLEHAGLVPDPRTRAVVETIFGAAPNVRSIETLAARMCQSRRTLGRFFRDRDLPVPSHWLQFARILHVAIHIQNTRASINRVSARFGYNDGFTMSNSMKRLTGHRPSFVREHLGWEWIIEAWLRRERGG
ncbi:MAG: helix-turn-helix domain-containing protein [Gemmatimonadota bacterium]